MDYDTYDDMTAHLLVRNLLFRSSQKVTSIMLSWQYAVEKPAELADAQRTPNALKIWWNQRSVP